MESKLYFGIAATIRFWLLFSEYNNSILDRVELATPLNSWRRVKEGVTLYEENIDPYIGDLFHRTPIELVALSWIIRHMSPFFIDALFVFCDLLTSYILYKTTQLYLQNQVRSQKVQRSKYAKGTDHLLLSKGDVTMSPKYVLYAYLFNPYIVLNCAARTTTVFSNLLASIVLFTMVKRKILLCSMVLAACTLESFYSWILMVPICLYYCQQHTSNKLRGILLSVISFLTSFAILLWICYYITGNWNFIKSTIIFILSVPDLKPNIGIFWYFFTEMFEHFRSLFLWSFQINTTLLYLFPLAVRFKDDPMLLAFSLITLTTIFKSYPCIGDVGFYVSLIPMWKHLFGFMQQGFMVLCFFIVCTAFAPTVWHLWIYSGSANANFYFGVTLAFATAQVFLLTDIMFAHTKWQFTVTHGDAKSSNLKLILK